MRFLFSFVMVFWLWGHFIYAVPNKYNDRGRVRIGVVSPVCPLCTDSVSYNDWLRSSIAVATEALRQAEQLESECAVWQAYPLQITVPSALAHRPTSKL